jgi:hypothetical protein
MSKMSSHDSFGYTSYGQKKGRESNWQFDFQPLKVWNRPDFYLWKAFNKGYNFASDLISIGGLHTKLWGPKVAGVLTLGISSDALPSP